MNVNRKLLNKSFRLLNVLSKQNYSNLPSIQCPIVTKSVQWHTWTSSRKTLLNSLSSTGKCYQYSSPAKNLSTNWQAPVVNYDYIVELEKHPEKTLVDVREPNELIESGQIPHSINVPLGQVQNAFSSNTSDEEFAKLYGHKKPSKDDEIIFSCRSGRRSENAANIVHQLGYTVIKNYQGSWIDYAEHQEKKK